MVASGALLAGVTLLASELLWLLQVLELEFVTFGNLDRQHDVEQNGDQKIIIIIRLKNDGIIRLS